MAGEVEQCEDIGAHSVMRVSGSLDFVIDSGKAPKSYFRIAGHHSKLTTFRRVMTFRELIPFTLLTFIEILKYFKPVAVLP